MAATRTIAKYSSLPASHSFQPIALETCGPINNSAVDFLTDLGHRISSVTGEEREKQFLFQCIHANNRHKGNECQTNRNVFSLVLNAGRLFDVRISSGKLFHTFGPATTNTQHVIVVTQCVILVAAQHVILVTTQHVILVAAQHVILVTTQHVTLVAALHVIVVTTQDAIVVTQHVIPATHSMLH